MKERAIGCLLILIGVAGIVLDTAIFETAAKCIVVFAVFALVTAAGAAMLSAGISGDRQKRKTEAEKKALEMLGRELERGLMEGTEIAREKTEESEREKR